MKGFKTLNGYAQAVDNYDQIPKAVWAAIAVSFATCGGDRIEEAKEAIMAEWNALYVAGIVPQKPTGGKR